MRQLPFGTAQKAVLLKLTAPGMGGSWDQQGGGVLYESRAMTDAVCLSLVRLGYLDEKLKSNSARYTVNEAGHAQARKLRSWH